jgi:hypothetical protein
MASLVVRHKMGRSVRRTAIVSSDGARVRYQLPLYGSTFSEKVSIEVWGSTVHDGQRPFERMSWTDFGILQDCRVSPILTSSDRMGATDDIQSDSICIFFSCNCKSKQYHAHLVVTETDMKSWMDDEVKNSSAVQGFNLQLPELGRI